MKAKKTKRCMNRARCLHPRGPVLPISQFYKDKNRPDGHRYECKVCQRNYDKKKYKKNSKEQIARAKAYQNNHPEYLYLGWIRRKYGLKKEDYLSKLKGQNGLCAICGRKQNRTNATRLCVDHVHGSKPIKTRGLLCDKCNHALSLVDENIHILKEMIAYLEKWHG